jgi:hypothetical protein
MESNWRFSLRDLFATVAIFAIALTLTRLLLALAQAWDAPYYAIGLLFLDSATVVYAWGIAISGLLGKSVDRCWPRFATALFASAILLTMFAMFLPA